MPYSVSPRRTFTISGGKKSAKRSTRMPVSLGRDEVAELVQDDQHREADEREDVRVTLEPRHDELKLRPPAPTTSAAACSPRVGVRLVEVVEAAHRLRRRSPRACPRSRARCRGTPAARRGRRARPPRWRRSGRRARCRPPRRRRARAPGSGTSRGRAARRSGCPTAARSSGSTGTSARSGKWSA